MIPRAAAASKPFVMVYHGTLTPIYGLDIAVEAFALAYRQMPGAEFWILGSSLFGAQLAAALGLPFAFASHFAPAQLHEALRIYRQQFTPSAMLAKPYVMPGISVVAADTAREARKLMSSLLQAFVALRRGQPRQLPPPMEGFESQLQAGEIAMLQQSLACAVIGDAQQVRSGLEKFIQETQADELIITSQIFDHGARRHSFELVAAMMSS